MKSKLLETVKDLLVLVMDHGVMVTLAITILGLCGFRAPYLWLWLALGILPLVLYTIRAKVRNFFLFFGLHLPLPALVILFRQELVLTIVMMGEVVIYVFLSMVIKLKKMSCKEYLLQPLVSVCGIGLFAIINNKKGNPDWEKYYIVAAVLYVGCYCIYYFISRYQRFLIVNESSAANIPQKQIFSSGMRQLLIFVLGSAAVLLMTANIGWFSYILSWIGKGLLAIIRFLVKLFHREKEEPEILPEESMPQQRPDGGLGLEQGEAGLLWVILEKLVMVALAVILVVLMVKAVIKISRYLWDRFHAADQQDEGQLEDGIDIRETCTIEKTRKEAVNVFSFLSNRERIRKVYRKQILKNKKGIIGDHNPEMLNCLTAGECCEKLLAEKEAAELLKNVYEKARYSQENVTAEDVRLAKSAGR